MMAAQSLGGGMEGAGPEAPPEGMGEEGAAGDPQQDLVTGISMIEGAIEALGGASAEKARAHIEALKAIAQEGEAAAMPDEGPAPENATEAAPSGGAPADTALGGGY